MGRAAALALSAVLVLALLGSGVFGERGVRRHQVLSAQLAGLEARVAEAEARRHRLIEEARALEDPTYQAWLVRQELGWVAPEDRILRLE